MSEAVQKLIAASTSLAALGLSAENAAAHFIGFTGSMDAGRKKWKAEILEQWQASFNMPRKKKKQVRKELRLDWSIANYDPFSLGEL